jgi:hypothetical protein
VDGAPQVLEMKMWVAEESIQQFGQLTLHASVNGRELEPAVFATPGLAAFTRSLGGSGEGVLEIRFRLDHALPPDEVDSRERGVIVARLAVE